MAEDDLTDKQSAFVAEYLKDLNGKQAAIRAGYAVGSAEVAAAKLLKVAKVKAAIDAALAARANRVQVEADDVLRELKAIGLADLSAPEEEPGKDGDPPRKPRELPRYDHKLKALELLGKHLRLFIDRQEQTGADGGPLVVEIHKYERED